MRLLKSKKVLALMMCITLLNLSLIGQVTILQPAAVESYVIRKEAVTDAAQIVALTNAEKTRQISYVDGFGRPLQSIIIAGSVK